MNRLSKTFNKQQSRYGGYATLLTTIVIIIIIVINLLVGEIDLTFDASQGNVFSISDASTQVAKEVSEPVTIYGLFEIGDESDGYNLIISNYTKASKEISSKNIDPIKNPVFAKQYAEDGETISEGSFIVVANNTGRYKVIHSDEVIAGAYDTATGKQVKTIVLEQQVTSALKYVTSNELPTVYAVTGHGEQTLAKAVIDEMTLENIAVKELVLLDHGMVPEDCDVLIIYGPTADLSQAEVEILNDYLNDFGSAMFLMGMVEKPMPNFTKVLENYGVNVNQESIVFESNPGNFYQSPVLLIPNIEEHSINTPLMDEGARMTFMTSGYVETLDIIRDELTIEALLTTSNSAYAKSNISDDMVAQQLPGDAQGPFTIATAITDDKEWDASTGLYNTAKLVVIANPVFLESNAYAAEPNFDFFIYATNWLAGYDESAPIVIGPKNLEVVPLQMNTTEIYTYTAITVIVIPFGIMITGLVIWKKRRHL